MSAWLESALSQANAKLSAAESEQSHLYPIKKLGLASLSAAKWPTRKVEAWKYTSLYDLGLQQFSTSATVTSKAEHIEGISFIEIVFSQGQWQLDALVDLPKGLSISLLSNAANAPSGLNAIKPEKHLFGQLNDCLVDDVLLISVEDGAVIDTAIRLHFDNADNSEQHAKAFVSVGEESQLSIVENFIGQAKSLTSLFSEYDVKANGKLSHYRFQLQTGQSYCIGGAHFNMSDHSQLDSQIVGFGSKLSRLDVDVIHNGEHVFAKMNAIYLLDGEEHFDLHTIIEHVKPNGTTEENVRGIVADRSQAVFNGRIHIHRDAQKTLAELNNRNLLLSRRAEINTKPELEIYADDVKCAHGATVAEVNQAAVYYLTSRGISRAEALVMLNFGFINELVDQMPNQAIAQWLRPQLRERFTAMKAD